MKNKILTLIAAIVMTTTFVSADVGDYGCDMMGGMIGSYGTGWMFFGWIFYLLIIALIIAAIYWLIKSANRRK